MLTELKKIIGDQLYFNTALESAVESLVDNDEDIEDIFLSEMESEGNGGTVASQDDDEALERMIDELPTPDDGSEPTEKEIEEILENYIPDFL